MSPPETSRGVVSITRGRTAVAFLVTLALTFVGLLFPTMASAAVITNAITDVRFNDSTGSNWIQERVDIDWAVPDSAGAGDTFTLQLPPELTAVTSSFELRTPAPENALVATASSNGSGLYTFTLTSFADTHNNVSGSAYFSVMFKDQAPGTTPSFTFTTGNGTYSPTIEVVDSGPVGAPTEPVKRGGFVNANVLGWFIEIPNSANGYGTFTMTDTIGAGQRLRCEEVTLTNGWFNSAEGPNWDAYGHNTGSAIPANRVSGVTCTDTSFEVTFSGLQPGDGLQMYYQTEITDHSLATFENTFSFTSDDASSNSIPGEPVVNPEAGGNGNGENNPEIDIEKWSTADAYPAGDFDTAPGKTVTAGVDEAISFTITNNGDEPLKDVEVTDQVTAGGASINGLSCDFSALGGPATGATWAGPFNPADSFTCTATLSGLVAGVQHTDVAKVTGVGVTSGTPVDDEDAWNGLPVEPATPSIDIEKWSTADAYPAGDFDVVPGKALTAGVDEAISFTITNDGNEALNTIEVTDQVTAGGASINGLSCDFSALGGPATGTTWAGPFNPADSFTCTATLSGLVAGVQHTDVAKVTGVGVTSGTPVDDEDAWNGHPETPVAPAIDIEKWSTADSFPAGDFDAAPGKTLVAGISEAISFTITNTGTEALTSVVVSDLTTAGGVNLTGLSCDFSALGGPATGTTWDGPFGPADFFICTATLPGLTAGVQHTDVATVTGVGVTSGTPVDDEDAWNGIAQPPVAPAIDIEKWSTADGNPAGDFDVAPGKTLVPGVDEDISFTITNTGNEALTSVVVTDETTAGGVDLTGLSCDFSALGGPATGTTWDGPFNPADSFDCTATLPGLSADVQHTNLASVAGVGVTSGIEVDDEDPWNAIAPTPPNPSIDVEKYSTEDGAIDGDYDTAPGKLVPAGATVPVTMTITNNGDEALTAVVVKDTTDLGPAMTGLSCDFSALGGPSTGTTWDGPFNPGDTFDCTGTVPALSVGTVHADTVDVAGVGQISGEGVVDDDPFNVEPPKPKPSIEIVKGDEAGNAADTEDDMVLLPEGKTGLVFTVTNNGNEALRDVTVSDVVVTNGTVENLECVFPDGSKGLTWAGPLETLESFTCTAELKDVETGSIHKDVAEVDATGVVSGIPVDDDNPYYAITPKALASTGQSGAELLIASALVLLLGGAGALILSRRRQQVEVQR